MKHEVLKCTEVLENCQKMIIRKIKIMQYPVITIVYHTCYACQHGLCAHVQNTCQLRTFTCQQTFQCANGVPIIRLCLPKGIPIFQLFFKRIFQFLNFSIISTFENFTKQRIQILTCAKFHS